MMSRATRWLQYIAMLLVGSTGLVYGVMRYVMQPAEPWDLVNHPLQPLVQHLHVLVAPILVFAFGVVWSEHAQWRLRQPGAQRRSSALTLLIGFVPMAASGYLLQVSTEPTWRQIFGWVHLATALLWFASYAAHVLQLGRNRG